ncbi:interferon-induced protein 44-like [Chanos chanos]|uniref:Interferon-induced protein 44-like n=1 Tax=Chanos chanos TaxID=29144 RepID=A0A6J2WBM5_CHACN|nr:interferon-induced protein 44-like [Chanos chanos]
MIQFDPDRDHLFWSDRILVCWSGLWSEAAFTPAILVRTKLKSLKVWTKQEAKDDTNNLLYGYTRHQTQSLIEEHLDGRDYKTYTFQNDEDSGPLPFVISDVMGLETTESGGVHSDDIINILKGHIKEDYKFNPGAPLSEHDIGYNQNPHVTDKVHCLISIIPADKISLMQNGVIEKMRTIREKARDLGIPQVVIMTKVDEACQLVKNDMKKIYTSTKIRQKMDECHSKLGVPLNCIFPVKNYHEETSLNPEVDCVILDALKHILNFAHDCMITLVPPVKQ